MQNKMNILKLIQWYMNKRFGRVCAIKPPLGWSKCIPKNIFYKIYYMLILKPDYLMCKYLHATFCYPYYITDKDKELVDYRKWPNDFR